MLQKHSTIFRQRFAKQRAVVAGPAGFEPATSGLEGRRPILLGYGPSLLSFRGALIKVAVKEKGEENGDHFLLLSRTGRSARPTMIPGPQIPPSSPVEVVLVFPSISSGLLPSTIRAVHCSSQVL